MASSVAVGALRAGIIQTTSNPRTHITTTHSLRRAATAYTRHFHNSSRQNHSTSKTRPATDTFRSPLPRPLTQTTRRLKSTSSRNRNFIRPRYVPLLLLLAAAGVAWDSQWLFPSSTPTDPTEATVLSNAQKFVHFDVTSKEQVSPTSFILTLKPPASRGGAVAPLSSLWDLFDLWCVEVKQPQIQVAREYTPLPPNPADHPDPDDALRLYVRALRGGEVSTYLSRLAPGDTVEIRGPHGEFDLSSRLGGAGGRVVFLAGGTGIASALQAARAVLPRAVDVTVFWAVRSREEVQRLEEPAKREKKSSWGWNPFARGLKEETIRAEMLSAERGHASPIARELLALKKKYGAKLDVRVVVDQEGTHIEQRDLAAVISQSVGSAPTPAPVETAGCRFHSQAAHLGMVDGAPNAGKKFLFRKQEDCGCVSEEDVPVGKNVFVVSGPEGFVQAYAGPKIWRDGGQLQGPVGGMLGALQKANPELLKDWIVLKL